jgi:hypothetical protein
MILRVSLPTYNEILGLLEAKGITFEEGKPLTLEKGTNLVRPIDMRQATMRRDAATIAASMGFKSIQDIDEIYQYILNGKNEKKEEWK